MTFSGGTGLSAGFGWPGRSQPAKNKEQETKRPADQQTGETKGPPAALLLVCVPVALWIRRIALPCLLSSGRRRTGPHRWHRNFFRTDDDDRCHHAKNELRENKPRPVDPLLEKGIHDAHE